MDEHDWTINETLWKNAALSSYMYGDRIGAPFEGGGTFTLEDALRRQSEYPNGTDESDIVRCFMEFMADPSTRGYESGWRLAAWAEFVTKNRRATRYGGTWSRFFALVRFLDNVSYDKLVEISKDANSFGNGCLPLAVCAAEYQFYPEMLEQLIVMTHHHPDALLACRMVCFMTGKSLNRSMEFAPTSADDDRLAAFEALDDSRLADVTPHALGCLVAARRCAAGASEMSDIIARAGRIGGDVDSYMALAFFLHTKGWK
jgi:hypothetical protein